MTIIVVKYDWLASPRGESRHYDEIFLLARGMIFGLWDPEGLRLAEGREVTGVDVAVDQMLSSA
jgi:hypothetical protein